MKIIKVLTTVGAFLLLAIIISACSVQVQTEEAAAVDVTKKAMSDPNAHTHPANQCTKSITHSHRLPGGSKNHTHHYSCKGKATKSANTHRHPANKCTRSTTHTHAGGNKAHTHKYVCRPGGRRNYGNAHVHSANSLTRSVRHVHPGGNRRHSHHYGR